MNAESQQPKPGARPWRSFGGAVFSRYSTVVLLALLIGLFTFLSPAFLTARNWSNLLVVEVVVASLSLGVLMVLVVGEFDLSVGYMVGFVAMAGAWIAGHGGHGPTVIAAMLGIGLLFGLVNGVLTVYLRISSFIATLAMGIVLDALTLGLSGGQVLFTNIPPSVTALGQDAIAGLGIPVWISLALAALLFYVLEHTPVGRYMYAIGGGERVAFLAGVPTSLIKLCVFGATGLFVAIGAIFALGQSGAANPGFGVNLLLPAYAAVFLGVTTYSPGYFNVIGTIAAILLLAVGYNGLSLLGAPFWSEPLFNGLALLVAVLIVRSESRHIQSMS